MKLHEILEFHEENGNFENTISWQTVAPYRKVLRAYYKEEFPSGTPVFMCTSVFNAVQYGQIVCEESLEEAIERYIQSEDMQYRDAEYERELINYRMFKL